MVRMDSQSMESSLILLSAEVRFTFDSDKTRLMVIFPVALVSFWRGSVSFWEMKKQISRVKSMDTPLIARKIPRKLWRGLYTASSGFVTITVSHSQGQSHRLKAWKFPLLYESDGFGTLLGCVSLFHCKNPGFPKLYKDRPAPCVYCK